MPRARIPESSAALSVLLFAAVVLVLVFAKVVLIPLAFALVFSFLLAPAVARLEKWGLRRPMAVAAMVLLTCTCIGVGAYVLSREALSVVQTLPDYRANIQRKVGLLHPSHESRLQETITMLEDLGKQLSSGSTAAPGEVVKVQVVGQASDQLRSELELARTILKPFGQFGIAIVFSIYMLMNREELRHRLLLLAGMGNINVMTQALEEASARISQYLLMQLRVNACYGTFIGIGLHFLHVPQAFLWGVIAGTLRMVPVVGSATGMILPVMLSIAISTTWWNPLAVWGLFVVTSSTTANLIEPRLFSSRTGISSLALLTSAICWSVLWGIPGLVLSTPLTVCVVVLGRHIPQLSFLHSLLGTDATLSPAARLYERLLAMDQTEALAVAESQLNGKPLSELYDSVILPVLSLVEEDRHKGVLDDVRWNFVMLTLQDIVARLSEYQPAESQAAAPSGALRAKPHQEFAALCISAGDQAAELATQMLGQILDREGFQTLVLSSESVSEDLLRGLSAGTSNVVFLSALPPFAFAQSRALCQRVRTFMPENHIAVALWNSRDDAEDMLPRFGSARPDAVLSTLHAALVQVETWRLAARKSLVS